MDVFPAFIPLAGRRVVVAGEGEAAEAKARLFDGSPAIVARVAGDAALRDDAYAGAALAFIAGPEAFCIAAAGVARRAGVPVNVVDRPAMSDFQTPAIVDRGAVVGAIGTGGSAPLLGTRLRNALEAQWPQRLGDIAELFRALQPEIRAKLPDLDARRAVLRAVLDGPAAEAALAGDMAQALAVARAALDHPNPPVGRLWRLQAPSHVDLLSLRALRVLGRADRIVASQSAAAELLTLARRDAFRSDPAEVSGATLAAWIAQGQAVVRIIVGDEAAEDLAEAEGLGLSADPLPTASSDKDLKSS
jgi:precorrin-2 dehydrogenase/sirohydrochlorin ferrochelatase